MISPALLDLVRCPECRGPLARSAAGWQCTAGHGDFTQHSADYLDLRPRASFAETTKYTDEALHADARHESVSPPLLSAAIRLAMLQDFLDPRPGDRIADLGCGSGRVLVWLRERGAQLLGIDVSPFFAHEARAGTDLVLADLRRLPFADRTFGKAYSLDVLEHLSPAALEAMLAEAARVLEPGGALFVYSHVRKNAPIAAGLRWINALARRLERVGLIDMTQERLRKSDHLNPLADVPELREVARRAGFRVSRLRFYTPLVGGLVENILARMAEHWLARRAAGRAASAGHGASSQDAVRAARTSAKHVVARKGLVYVALRALTAVMRLDIVLFSRIESGPFFALLVREPAPPAPLGLDGMDADRPTSMGRTSMPS